MDISKVIEELQTRIEQVNTTIDNLASTKERILRQIRELQQNQEIIAKWEKSIRDRNQDGELRP